MKIALSVEGMLILGRLLICYCFNQISLPHSPPQECWQQPRGVPWCALGTNTYAAPLPPTSSSSSSSSLEVAAMELTCSYYVLQASSRMRGLLLLLVSAALQRKRKNVACEEMLNLVSVPST
jgi:hypothetical protein